VAERGSQTPDAVMKVSKTQPVVAEGERRPLGIVLDSSFNGMNVHHLRFSRSKTPAIKRRRAPESRFL
jgi:hypothetical protein